MVTVQESYSYCEEVIKVHSKTFYKAFSFLPDEKRRAVWAVYSFCRTVDDIVDEGKRPLEELAVFKEQFKQFLNGKIPATEPMWIALQHVFQQFEMEEQAFLDMIKGQEMDLYKSHYETVEELEYYSYHVASTVGLMLLPILAPEQKELVRKGAIYLGIGMQFTNVLRDIAEDLDRGRVYLPSSIMAEHGYTEDDLKKEVVDNRFIMAWESIAMRAEVFYAKFNETLDHYPIDSRMPVQLASIYYREILNKVRKQNYKVFSSRAFVSSEEKGDLFKKIAVE
ncbi:phytoene/squalene synthase family protein [Fictibacillus phosphorivorans]|uniref:phytoene/squalene synthase family protein n=1 Tax=Fictibacillus phosphorivorans TaxID=1221500 RepID=UPI0009EEEC6D|nr:phytoene/squalene synthase family protein [Fictibacillus phosphorivorans]